MIRKFVSELRARRDYYLTIALGIVGWLIVFFNSENISALLPRYAGF